MLGPDSGGSSHSGWLTLERLAWAIAIAVTAALLGVLAVAGGQPFVVGPISLIVGLSVWRFLRRVNHDRQRATVEWLNAYAESIDGPRDDPSFTSRREHTLERDTE